MNEFKWTKKLLLFFIKDIFEGILSHDFFLPLIYIFFRQKYEKGNLNEILNILIKFYGDEASEINRNTTHGVLMIPHLILKAADVTSSKVILWGLSSTQYGSFRSSSSFSSCKQKTHTHTLTLFPSPTLLCSNVFAQWAKKPDRISNARRFDRESTVHRFILQYPLFIPPENPPDKIFDRSRVLASDVAIITWRIVVADESKSLLPLSAIRSNSWPFWFKFLMVRSRGENGEKWTAR